MLFKSVLISSETKNGDYAIFARAAFNEPWVQVEATKGERAAIVYARHLDENEEDRLEEIDDAEQGGIDWGDSVLAEGDVNTVYP